MSIWRKEIKRAVFTSGKENLGEALGRLKQRDQGLGHAKLCSKSEVSLSYLKPCLKTEKKKNLGRFYS